jgi:hypothetical protein
MYHLGFLTKFHACPPLPLNYKRFVQKPSASNPDYVLQCHCQSKLVNPNHCRSLTLNFIYYPLRLSVFYTFRIVALRWWLAVLVLDHQQNLQQTESKGGKVCCNADQVGDLAILPLEQSLHGSITKQIPESPFGLPDDLIQRAPHHEPVRQVGPGGFGPRMPSLRPAKWSQTIQASYHPQGPTAFPASRRVAPPPAPAVTPPEASSGQTLSTPRGELGALQRFLAGQSSRGHSGSRR